MALDGGRIVVPRASALPMVVAWFLAAERDRMIAPETQRFMAHRSGAHVHSLEADHTPLASAPDQVVAIITEAVDHVAQGLLDPARIGGHI